MRFFLLFTVLVTSCATRYHLAGEYLEKVKSSPLAHDSKQTTILFLVDGLSYSIVEERLKKNKLPNIKDYFLVRNRPLQKAHSVFPTLTFTNISSLLHEQPVHLTGAIGNKIITNNRLVDFENVSDRTQFSATMRGNTIFSRLNGKGFNTVSLDYGLGVDASVSSNFDFQSGYAASQLDYTYLDRKKIDGLKILLTEANQNQWPEFIFIHLVGVDFLSHRYGPRSEQVNFYLAQLDRQLKSLFELLRRKEKVHQIISLLTADHGFNLQKHHFVNIESKIKRLDTTMRIVNEGRHAAVYYIDRPSDSKLLIDSAHLLNQKGVEIVATRSGMRLWINSKKTGFYIDYLKGGDCGYGALLVSVNGREIYCSNALPQDIDRNFYPFFVENLISYFQAAKAPDLLVVPESDVIFSRNGTGFHGGPTEDETIVPLLTRNLNDRTPSSGPAIWQLLSFIK